MMKQKFLILISLCLLIIAFMTAGCGQKEVASDTNLPSSSSSASGTSSGEASSMVSGSENKDEFGANFASGREEPQVDTSVDETVPTEVAGIEDVSILINEGEELGSIIVSGYLSSDKGTFIFDNGKEYNWIYTNVSAGSTCTITSTGLYYPEISLSAWTLEDGIYVRSEDYDRWYWLYQDGEIKEGVFEADFEKFAIPDHPASFTFGKNAGEYSTFELKTDGTMYLLEIVFYDESGEFVTMWSIPCFVK